MPTQRHSLRVALIYRGTVLRERTFKATSDPHVTVGGGDESLFDVDAPGLGAGIEMFERTRAGYRFRFTDRLAGDLHVSDREYSLADLIDSGAGTFGHVDTGDGPSRIHETTLANGDWGLIDLGDAQLYFQVAGRPAEIAGRGFDGLDLPVVGTVALAALLHLGFLFACFLAFDIAPELNRRHVQDRFASAMVDDVEDPLDETKEDDPSEDASSKKAPGEEGEFGEPDEKVESKVPKEDGPLKDEVDPEKVGVNKILQASNSLGSGPLENIFGDQKGFDARLDVRMSGDDGELRVGRGTEGMAMRGTDSGGGGDDGFGEIHGLGTEPGMGGGDGPSAKIRDKDRREVKPDMSRGNPTVGDYCDRSDIRRVVSAKANALQYCYERQLQTQPDLQGKIVAQWKIGLDGKVKTASIASSTLDNPRVASCITRTLRRMRFAKPNGGICIINYPFVFSGLQ